MADAPEAGDSITEGTVTKYAYVDSYGTTHIYLIDVDKKYKDTSPVEGSDNVITSGGVMKMSQGLTQSISELGTSLEGKISTASSEINKKIETNADDIAVAQSTADGAQSSANTAQRAADSAKTSASNAQASADDAQTSADKAQTSADKAQASADSAQSTANTAVSKADGISVDLNLSGTSLKATVNGKSDTVTLPSASSTTLGLVKVDTGITSSDNPVRNRAVQDALNRKLNTSLKGKSNGLAELDGNGRVPSSQLPSYVDDVVEGYYYNGGFYMDSAHNTPISKETGKIYIDKDTNKTYRYGGSSFVEISASLALGESSSTAYRGDRGMIAYDHSQKTVGNPHRVTKSDVGLGNVDNTSDANKPVSTAQQNALNDKSNKNHTHPIQLSKDGASPSITLENGATYKLTAGGKATVFKIPTIDSYALPKATTNDLGGIIVGNNLSIDSNGKLSAYEPKLDVSYDSAQTMVTVKLI